jgi:hypothetical protein
MSASAGDPQHPVDQLEAVDDPLGRPAEPPPPAGHVRVDQRPRPPVHVVDRPGGEVEVAQQQVRGQVVLGAVLVAEQPGDLVVRSRRSTSALPLSFRGDEVQRDPDRRAAGPRRRRAGAVGGAEVAGGDQRVEPDVPTSAAAAQRRDWTSRSPRRRP